ncbi:carbamoyl-phosphate-synthetase [Propionicimonas sp.]|uniref:carbamoyl-phosphate-synthetase n=1 Tax=Propionicimonas sp. TaxID=1955623 RepID=UPI0039E6ED75
MKRTRVLLSEASSLTAREFTTVLGRSGVEVEAVSSAGLPLVRFSRWCRRVHRAPAPSEDPEGYLHRVDALMATGDFDALLPTHEQAWLFAAGRDLLPHSRVAVATIDAFDQVQSKTAFATLLDTLGLPQPAWRRVQSAGDLEAVGFPVWVKTAFSTAGRGVARASDPEQARMLWRRFTAAAPAVPVMVQACAEGRYAQVQGLFDHGRLLAGAVSEQLAVGAGGSAAARLSVDHPHAIDAIRTLGGHLGWHGGLTLDYLHLNGHPSFIECNPRTIEPGNAAAAGVDLPTLTIALTRGGDLPEFPLLTRAGVRTRSTMAIALGAAEQRHTRRAILAALTASLRRIPPLQGSTEVLTPVLADPPSLIPFAIAVGTVLAGPARVASLAGATVEAYAVTPSALERVRPAR